MQAGLIHEQLKKRPPPSRATIDAICRQLSGVAAARSTVAEVATLALSEAPRVTRGSLAGPQKQKAP
jgi:hypothetical protein